jgi:hypothetical protein
MFPLNLRSVYTTSVYNSRRYEAGKARHRCPVTSNLVEACSFAERTLSGIEVDTAKEF